MNSRSGKRDNRFAFVMCLSLALGIAVALAVLFLWRSHPVAFQDWPGVVALIVCPPFILSYAIGSTPDSAFAVVLGVGTIVLANAFLYAGVAAGIYAMATVVRKKKV